MNGYLISGDDEFEIKRHVRIVADEVMSRNPDLEMDVVEGDNDERSPAEVIRDLVTALSMDSLFGSEKLVWLKHCSFFSVAGSGDDESSKKAKSKGKSKGKSDVFTPLLEMISANEIPQSITLLLDGPGIDRRKIFYKTCDAAGFKIEWFSKPDPMDRQYAQLVHSRIEDVLRAGGVSVTHDAMECLKGMLGGDSARIHTEIEKLICYAGDKKKISRQDCLDVCSHTPEALSWALTDALKSRNISAALTAIDELIAQMESESGSGYEMRLLASVSGEFQNLIKCREALDALELDPSRVNANTFKQFEGQKDRYPGNILLGMHPFRAYKIAETLTAFSDTALVQALHDILQTNRELVSSDADNKRLALEQLAFRIAGKGKVR